MFCISSAFKSFPVISLLSLLPPQCKQQERRTKRYTGHYAETTRREGSSPMNISEGTLNPFNEEKEPQNSSEASITNFSCTTMVEWVLNDADTRNKQFNSQGQELTEPLFLQILGFIPNKRKRCKRKKMHQGSPNQETKAVSDARLALRKIVRKGRSLVAQSPASPENCKKSAIEVNWKHKIEGKAEAVQGLTKLKWDFYQAYMVMIHIHWMILKHIINFTEKIMPTLADSICLTQPKAKDSQPTLLRKILNACDIKE